MPKTTVTITNGVGRTRVIEDPEVIAVHTGKSAGRTVRLIAYERGPDDKRTLVSSLEIPRATLMVLLGAEARRPTVTLDTLKTGVDRLRGVA